MHGYSTFASDVSFTSSVDRVVLSLPKNHDNVNAPPPPPPPDPLHLPLEAKAQKTNKQKNEQARNKGKTNTPVAISFTHYIIITIITYIDKEPFLTGAHGVLPLLTTFIIIIIMYIYHALINALSAHMIHINLNMIFYTHVEHSPTKTIYIK